MYMILCLRSNIDTPGTCRKEVKKIAVSTLRKTVNLRLLDTYDICDDLRHIIIDNDNRV